MYRPYNSSPGRATLRHFFRGQGTTGGRHATRTKATTFGFAGLDGLTKRELKQLELANTLMCFAIDMAVALLHTRGTCISEHPAEPRRVEAASKWRLFEVRAILASPAASKLTFRQSVHGATSAKPTTMLVIRAPELRKFLYKAQLPLQEDRIQDETLIGRDAATGKWKTAKAKEYPPSLCMAFAKAIRANIVVHSKGHKRELINQDHCTTDSCQDLRPFVVSHDPYEPELAMMQDCMDFNT